MRLHPGSKYRARVLGRGGEAEREDEFSPQARGRARAAWVLGRYANSVGI